MLALHGSPDDIRENVFYLHNPSHDQIRTAQQWAQENHPDIVVLDGLAESMAAVGSDENKAADVLGFFRETLRPFAEAGAAVVIADHVTKSSENRGQFARGSGAKAGRYDGVSYEVAPAMQYTPTQAGFVRLKIQKDRNGGAGPRGKIVAELHFTPGVDGRTITAFRQPEQSEGPFRPTVYMEKIVKHIELYGTSTQSNLRKVGGKSQYIDKAIEVLLNEKTIGFHKVGQSHQYFLITPKGGVCSSVPTVFHACSELEEQPCSPVPPPTVMLPTLFRWFTQGFLRYAFMVLEEKSVRRASGEWSLMYPEELQAAFPSIDIRKNGTYRACYLVNCLRGDSGAVNELRVYSQNYTPVFRIMIELVNPEGIPEVCQPWWTSRTVPLPPYRMDLSKPVTELDEDGLPKVPIT